MNTGERLKLLRILGGYNQTYIADLVGVKQRTIAGIESSRARPRASVIDILGKVYGCSPDWLTEGKLPAYPSLWGYTAVPNERLLVLDQPVRTRKLNELDDFLRTSFVDFLREMAISNYYIASADEIRKIYVFPLSLPVFFALKCKAEFWDAVDYATSQTNLKMVKQVTMTSAEIDCIDDPQSGCTILAIVEKMLVLMDLVKPGIAKEQWIPFLESPALKDIDRQAKMIYNKKVNELSRMIIENNIEFFDIWESLKKYSRNYHGGLNPVEVWEKQIKVLKEYKG
jgi:transcriptional regulator with XRE-family HTH domain